MEEDSSPYFAGRVVYDLLHSVTQVLISSSYVGATRPDARALPNNVVNPSYNYLNQWLSLETRYEPSSGMLEPHYARRWRPNRPALDI